MVGSMKHLMQVEEGKEAAGGAPSAGPTYRCAAGGKGASPPAVPGLDCCWDIFRLSVEKCPDNKMLGRREILDGKAGKYTWLTYKEVYDSVLKVGAAIRSCGVGKGGRCGIYGANSPEWVVSMQACNAHGIYCVPLYDTLGAGAVDFILCHAEVQIVFVEEKKIGEVLKTFPNATKVLKTIVSFGKVNPEHKEKVEQNGLSIYSWEEFLQLGGEEKIELPQKEKDDICTIMYTSGTTGDPKGVLISNRSIITIVSAVNEFLSNSNEQLREDDVYISYLPLAHIFDRVIEEVFIHHGASIGFWRGDVKLLVEDIGELKPTIFCAVPRVLDRIYGGMQDKITTGGFLKKTLFNVAYKYKQGNMMKGSKHEDAAAIFDKLVFTKVKQRLGGRVRLILSGAAPLSRHVEEYLRVVTCSNVLQGYGLTETCAGSFVSLPNNMSMLGTVGPPVPYVEVRLESVPEMGYDALSSQSPRGEICIRGDTLFSGYYKREDLTKEVLVDGWFHTGDIGEWQPDGSMKIIDRKKNIFKLSQGEYVAVENLENIFGQTPGVDSIWVYGNSFESSLIAVVNPNKQALERWAESNGVTGDFASICEDPKAKEFILGELTKIGKEKKLKGFEFIKAVHLDPVPFDMERDLITPTYKKKRPQLLKYYQSIIDGMYKSMK
ncbi:long chain acyl-CoA synthetase 4-like isoform X2 [Phragmites australis]|uniref:long chain acyl-CoA synthetase 4-like isoform X2 n=1 Tax=Phragmites australis TaxID=29695 RepID=UPI002D7A32E7|nr:long chain acyl-CoA synthetase 4-like isoform X2 [Phragmites australis]